MYLVMIDHVRRVTRFLQVAIAQDRGCGGIRVNARIGKSLVFLAIARANERASSAWLAASSEAWSTLRLPCERV